MYSSTQKNFNLKFVVQIFSTNGNQSHLKLQARVQKNFFFPTLNAHIFQSTRSNFMQFLPHNLRQVQYKILQFYYKTNVFFLLSWANKANMAIFSKEIGLETLEVKP